MCLGGVEMSWFRYFGDSDSLFLSVGHGGNIVFYVSSDTAGDHNGKCDLVHLKDHLEKKEFSLREKIRSELAGK